MKIIIDCNKISDTLQGQLIHQLRYWGVEFKTEESD